MKKLFAYILLYLLSFSLFGEQYSYYQNYKLFDSEIQCSLSITSLDNDEASGIVEFICLANNDQISNLLDSKFSLFYYYPFSQKVATYIWQPPEF